MKYASIVICHYSKINDFNNIPQDLNSLKKGDLLRKCIESVLIHTNYPAELIVLDNGGVPDDSDYLLGKAREGKLTHVRFPSNMHFAYAWNTGAKIATGQYLCFMCNDIEVSPNWLTECIRLLEEHPEEKLIATPINTRRKKTTILPNGNRLNPRAGSNCLVIRRKDFYAIGEWPIHRVGGSIWYNKLINMGYNCIAPPKDLVTDLGWKHGVNSSGIQVKKILLDGSEVYFEEKL